MKTIGVIQARMSSSRLPGKILAPLAGHPLLEVLFERVRAAPMDEWWLATSDTSRDTVTALWGEALGLRVWRGSEDDVLSRFAAIVERTRPDWVVRLTADDPFIDAAVVELILEATKHAPAGVAVIRESKERSGRRLPLGYCPEAARGSAILEAQAQLDASSPHRAHVLSSLEDIGTIDVPDHWVPRPQWRWTVDTDSDHEMAARAFQLFGTRWKTIGYEAMVEVLDDNPETTAINDDVRQREVVEG